MSIDQIDSSDSEKQGAKAKNPEMHLNKKVKQSIVNEPLGFMNAPIQQSSAKPKTRVFYFKDLIPLYCRSYSTRLKLQKIVNIIR